MDAKGRIDPAVFKARVSAVRGDSRYPDAKDRFCHDVPRFWLKSDFRRTLIADTGAYGVAIGITGMHRLDRENGASMQTVIAALEASGMASATRIRSMIYHLRDQRAIEIVPHHSDGRRLRLIPTAKLIGFQRRWFAAVLASVGMIFDLPTSPEELAETPELVERYLTGVMLRHLMDGFTIFDGFPEIETFMNRRHGYLLMLQLAGGKGLATEVDRAHVAEWFGVSPAHIATMLADAEKQGWLQRRPPKSTVVLDPAFADRLDLWVAREITIVGMWIEAKLGRGAR